MRATGFSNRLQDKPSAEAGSIYAFYKRNGAEQGPGLRTTLAQASYCNEKQRIKATRTRSVNAVDGSIPGHQFRGTHHPRERGQPIHRGKHLIGNDAGRDLPRPTDHRRRPHASLKRRVHEITAPRSIGTSPDLWNSTAARDVAAQNHDGVVLDTRFLGGVQNLTDAVVYLTDQVGVEPTALGGLTGEIRVGDERRMHLRVTHVDTEERFRRRVPFDVFEGLRDDVLPINCRRWRMNFALISRAAKADSYLRATDRPAIRPARCNRS